ncbi:alpha/beta fold hydrolase [Aquisalimonas asiatica]|uniref:Non-heme chloroperoxidase n=1 Tax=Aquisalimonas asiatica TaxID=406100 RepID=A0A1H8VMF7_9GAMM|nr:alpha/beta hydrolase [Aquisalimonas asiatica]SEP16490.1 non-heme chloroperoxidase [Aquisalimonas asiatica]
MSAGQRLPGTPEPMYTIDTDAGLRLAADAWGDPDAPLVMLLHGGGQTRHAWKGAGEALGAAGYRAVAFDARGHGDSDWAGEGGYEQGVMVDDLNAVIRAFGDRPAALVGASMGGGVGLLAAGEQRSDVAALVLVDIAPQMEQDGVARIMAFMQRHAGGFASLDEVAEAIQDYQPHRRRSANPDGLAKNVRQGADGRYYWHWDPAFLQVRRDFEARRQRLESSARQLRVPTLLVRGALSDVLSEEGVQAFLADCPHAEYVNVSDARHMVAGDGNDIFLDSVRAFLGREVASESGARGATGQR